MLSEIDQEHDQIAAGDYQPLSLNRAEPDSRL
jgi:hypothetical protein